MKLQREGKIGSLAEFLKVAEDRAYSRPGKLESGTEKYIQKAQKLWSVSQYNILGFVFITVKEKLIFLINLHF